MKTYRSLYIALIFSSVAAVTHADTFVLTDGTKIEGEILREEGDSYVIRAEISPGIRDNRTIKKSMVEKIEKDDPSIARFEAIKDTLPSPDLLDADDYKAVLDNQINPFLEEFPKSEHAPDVIQMKKVLEAEMEQIQNGGIKLNGKIITPEERALNQYEIDARLQYSQMQRYAKSRAFAPAMQKFEILERDYQATPYFDKGLDLAKQILPIFQQDLTKMSSEVDALVEKRKTTLDRLDSGNRDRALKLLEQEDADYAKALEDAKAAKMKWLPTNRFQKKEIDLNLKFLERETERLSKLKEREIDTGATYREILSHLDRNEVKEAKEKLRTFKSGRPPKSYSEALQIRIKEAEETMKEIEAEKKREEAEEARKAKEAKKAEADKKP